MTTIGPTAAPRRRSKIVCTLGPATAAPDRVAALVAAGMDVARLNFSHGDHADHEKVYRAVREAAERAGRVVGVLADLQGPKIRLGRFTDGPVHWPAGATVRITVDDVPGTPERVSTTYAALAADAQAGRPAARRRRPGRPRGRRRRGTGRRVHGDGRRHRVGQQGPVAARHGRLGAGTVGEGHRGPRVRPRSRRGPGRAVLRALARRHRPRPRGHGPRRAPRAGDREAGEAGGRRRHRGRGRRLRRADGRPRRPRRRDAARTRAARAEARDPTVPGEGEAGDRGHPDAGLDDRQPAAHPGGGVGRGERRPGRRRRRHALRGDQRRGLPGRDGRDDGPDHRGGRVRPVGPGPGPARGRPHATRPARAGGARDRRRSRRHGAGGLHPVRQHRPAPGAAAPAAAAGRADSRSARCATSSR